MVFMLQQLISFVCRWQQAETLMHGLDSKFAKEAQLDTAISDKPILAKNWPAIITVVQPSKSERDRRPPTFMDELLAQIRTIATWQGPADEDAGD